MRVSNIDIDRIYVNGIIRESTYRMSESHFHEYYELYYLQSGGTLMFLNKDLYTLRPGDILIIPPHEVHANRYTAQSFRYNVYFKASDLGERLAKELMDEYLVQTCYLHVPGTEREVVEQLLSAMVIEDKVNDEYTPDLMVNLLKSFFLQLKRHGYQPVPHTEAENQEDQKILEVARYISDNFAQEITLTSMAELAGLSPSYFSRRFKNVTGTGMKEYVSYLRLRRAAALLLSSSESITAIAVECGFSDSNYFKDAFKKMFGHSPRAYRKSIPTDFIMTNNIRNQSVRRKKHACTGHAQTP